METLKLYGKIAEYEATLKFVQDELMEDRIRLSELKKQDHPDKDLIEKTEHEIALFEQAVDEYQCKIKTLKSNVESICSSEV